jgi:SecD/SecF fusion protein
MTPLLPGVRRQLREAADRQATSPRRGARILNVPRSYLAPAVGVLVVLVVAAVFISAGGSSRPAESATVRVVFDASPTPGGQAVSAAAVARAGQIMRERIGAIFHDSQVTVSGSTVDVVVHNAAPEVRARIIALSAPGRLAFFDWEANALTPGGRTAASLLQFQAPAALAISQGLGGAAPGTSGAGSSTLYAAVKLAARQPARVSPDNERAGSQYYLFGAPGSTACTTAARDRGTAPTPALRCLLAGPDATRQQLLAGLPAGVRASEGQMLVVKPGTAVIQAADPGSGPRRSYTYPSSQFFVVRDHVALSETDTVSPRQGTDAAGSPDVSFGFTVKGANAFHRVTRTLARRGALLSGLGQTLNQHFAVAVDDRLLTVPQIDFKAYPDGIPGSGGADITGGFTVQSARDLATQLRFGALPVALEPQ